MVDRFDVLKRGSGYCLPYLAADEKVTWSILKDHLLPKDTISKRELMLDSMRTFWEEEMITFAPGFKRSFDNAVSYTATATYDEDPSSCILRCVIFFRRTYWAIKMGACNVDQSKMSSKGIRIIKFCTILDI